MSLLWLSLSMKQGLFVFCLLLGAAPLLANDEGGDGAYIPSYQELVREGYGAGATTELIRPDPNFVAPTQAYYGEGYVIYYGYTVVRTWGDPSTTYVFGHPLEYYRQMMATAGVNETNLNRYALEVRTTNSDYGPTDMVAKAREEAAQRAAGASVVQTNTVTPVKPTTSNGTAPLPAIGEKLSH
jgi:hypothetical protein